MGSERNGMSNIRWMMKNNVTQIPQISQIVVAATIDSE